MPKSGGRRNPSLPAEEDTQPERSLSLEPGQGAKFQSLAKEFDLQIQAGSSPGELTQLKSLKLGLYKPWVANMDEGWTRWIFENWEFPYTTVHDEEIRNGHLERKYDVIVLTNVSSENIVNGHKEGTIPSQYAGGIGEHGLAALLQFVKDGGTLVTLNASSQLPIDHFKVPLRNVAQSNPSTEFFLPSAILKVDVENTHPIAYGMENTANVLSFGSPVFEFVDTEKNDPRRQANLATGRKSRRPLSQRQPVYERSSHRRPCFA